jgi:hypothetical protein
MNSSFIKKNGHLNEDDFTKFSDELIPVMQGIKLIPVCSKILNFTAAPSFDVYRNAVIFGYFGGPDSDVYKSDIVVFPVFAEFSNSFLQNFINEWQEGYNMRKLLNGVMRTPSTYNGKIEVEPSYNSIQLFRYHLGKELIDRVKNTKLYDKDFDMVNVVVDVYSDEDQELHSNFKLYIEANIVLYA